ncbi:response regulator [Microseira wollei]|uniref:Multi-component transcriptional regulator, winged helix family protein n=1 Tax=Microseira wollei NIES-4236 TaxID=2530354 RepID=A0AAV3XTX9_9CYAN|nr:response regulator [Microseira wollei]GET44542.1 multi-component transcriptional regulator, winged helix family protein [Microseira wollei NIES-4236]
MRILLVEDDEHLAQVLKDTLTNQHYLVDLAPDGQVGWNLAEGIQYDLILLDLMLPKLDGISLCQRLRQAQNSTPVLLVTAQDASTSKVMALDAGADDYVVKPFDLQELLARIRALLRRGNTTSSPVIEWGNLRLDPSSCEVTYNGQLLHLTAKEYGLLELFLRNSNKIYSSSALLDHLWSFDEPPSENAVRAHIKSLRSKLKQAGAKADLIETVYRLGYRLKPKETEQVSRKDAESGRRGDGSSFAETFPASPCPRVPASSSPASSATSAITGIWKRYKETYLARIAVLEQAIAALEQSKLTEELRQSAVREAHTLVGSLGSFGFDKASHLSRQIEQTFKADTNPNPGQIEHLPQLVLALRQELERDPATSPLPTPAPIPVKQQSQLLIVDDDTALTAHLVTQATTWGMQAAAADNLSIAREFIAHTRPDVVLLDLCFPDSAENGFGLLAELATDQPPIPVLVFTAREGLSDPITAAQLGARGFLHKPVSASRVMEAIAQILQQSATPEGKLLVVDAEPQVFDLLRTLLEPWGFELTLPKNAQN